MNVPHDFSEFLSRTRGPLLFIGSGLSFGYVPLLHDLVASKKDRIETKFGTGGLGSADEPYKWAFVFLERLAAQGEPRPRLRLAEELGLLSDAAWTAQCSMPLRGTLPRHRILARFARERLIDSICSFNWDTYVEHALQQIGFIDALPRYPQPWLASFKTIVTAKDRSTFGRSDCFSILKPHGCVKALTEAKEAENAGAHIEANTLAGRFKITDEDLQNVNHHDPDDRWFFNQLAAQLGQRPMMTAGWSISEPYLQQVINDTLEDQIQAEVAGELTIIDVEFNLKGHQRAADIYKLSKNEVFAELEARPGGFGSDMFFLWLQAKYAMQELSRHCIGPLESFVQDLVDSLKSPAIDNPLLSWADTFLPAWIRLCWRSRLVHHQSFEPHMIPVDLEDAYVPLYEEGIRRADMTMAVNILWLAKKLDLILDFERYPGAIWDRVHSCLIIPLPADQPLDGLNALAKLVDVLERDIGFVTNISILPVPSAMTSAPDDKTLESMKTLLADQMSVPKFADPSNIGHIDIEATLLSDGHD